MTSADRDPRSRVVETGASRARFFGSNGHQVFPSQRCCVSPVVPFDFCNEIVKRRVAFCGRDPRSPRRSVWRCSIESTVLPSTSRRPLRRRRNARVERRVVRSLRRAELAWHPPHRTWGPAEAVLFWSLFLERHESRTSRITSRKIAEVKELVGLQPAAPPPDDPQGVFARPRSTCSRISCRPSVARTSWSRCVEEPKNLRLPPFRRTREGRRRGEPRCDPFPAEG